MDSYQRQIAVFTGDAEIIQPLSWEVADKRTYVKWAEKKYDVLVFGMPVQFHYGYGMGTNPILIKQAIAANIIRHKRVLREYPVIICAGLYDSLMTLSFYREIYNLSKPKIIILSMLKICEKLLDSEYIYKG